MCDNRRMKPMGTVFCIVLMQISSISGLLFPANTLLQLTASVSVPVIDLPPQRRINFDWGFQMNYNMPFAVSSFYNVPIWPTTTTTTTRTNATRREMKRATSKKLHCSDFTLPALYKGLQSMLTSNGYDGACLEYNICELMKYRLGEKLRLFGIFEDLLTLLTRPSRHYEIGNESFELLKPYLVAELRGYLELNCKEIYAECVENPLDMFLGNE